MDYDRNPYQDSECSREIKLQHESANAELEQRHCRKVEVLAKPEIHQVFRKMLLGDRRIPSMLTSSNESCHVAKARPSESTNLLLLSDHVCLSLIFGTYMRYCKKPVACVEIPFLLSPNAVPETKYYEHSTKEDHKRVTEFDGVGLVIQRKVHWRCGHVGTILGNTGLWRTSQGIGVLMASSSDCCYRAQEVIK